MQMFGTSFPRCEQAMMQWVDKLGIVCVEASWLNWHLVITTCVLCCEHFKVKLPAKILLVSWLCLWWVFIGIMPAIQHQWSLSCDRIVDIIDSYERRLANLKAELEQYRPSNSPVEKTLADGKELHKCKAMLKVQCYRDCRLWLQDVICCLW